MKRSYRDDKPRFHKHRLGKMLLPHNQLSGLFFTVNPSQESRALREAQLYLSTLTRDLEAAQEVFESGHGAISATLTTTTQDNGGDVDGNAALPKIEAPPASASLSSLLAAELAACGAQESRGNRYTVAKRTRANERGEGEEDRENGEDGQHAGCRRRDVPQRRSEWFAPLETGCKGYLFLNVPIVNARVTCPTCHAGANVTAATADVSVSSTAAEQDGDGSAAPSTSLGVADGNAMVSHTIVINPLVSRVTERIFKDLTVNPRPIFRNCFRLMPAELTCCPTLPEMQTALRELLALHFPPASAMVEADTIVAADDAVDFNELIPLPSWGTDAPRRSMHTVALQLTVKNNTNVEKKKATITAALTEAIPANRFIVVSQPSSKTKCAVEATVCVFVAHATCVMGVQRRIAERHGFNLHAVGEAAFVLSNSVTASPKSEQQQYKSGQD